MNRLSLSLLCCMLLFGACRLDTTSSGDSDQGNDLDSMQQAKVTIGEHEFTSWIASSADERNKGLMFVTNAQMADLEDGSTRGMLFVFETEQLLGFWMRNTIIPLDIAFARADGTIVKIHTMTPLDLSNYSSFEPARFALEVSAGVFSDLGISEGDRIDIPDDIVNP